MTLNFGQSAFLMALILVIWFLPIYHFDYTDASAPVEAY